MKKISFYSYSFFYYESVYWSLCIVVVQSSCIFSKLLAASSPLAENHVRARVPPANYFSFWRKQGGKDWFALTIQVSGAHCRFSFFLNRKNNFFSRWTRATDPRAKMRNISTPKNYGEMTSVKSDKNKSTFTAFVPFQTTMLERGTTKFSKTIWRKKSRTPRADRTHNPSNELSNHCYKTRWTDTSMYSTDMFVH